MYLQEVGCSGFMWLRTGLAMGPCEHGNEYSNSIKGIELCEHYSLLCHPAQRYRFRQACCIHLWHKTVKTETVNFFMTMIPSYQTTLHHIYPTRLLPSFLNLKFASPCIIMQFK